MSDTPEPVLRVATFDDFAGVAALLPQVGLGPALPDSWRHLWKENPALQGRGAELPMGWVLEAETSIVGYMGCIPLLYDYHGRTLLAAAATTLGVLPAYRNHSLRLVGAFFDLSAPDILIDTTANETAGKVFRLFGALPVPQSDYDRVLFWVLQPRAFLNAYLRKMKYRRAASIGGTLLALPLWCEMGVRQRKPLKYSRTLELTVMSPEQIGAEFDELWARKTREGKRLIGYRTAEVLHWHFAGPHPWGAVEFLAGRRKGKLAGYAALSREPTPELGLVRARILDVFVENDAPEIIDQLLEHAFQTARGNGSHVLELFGFPEFIRERMEAGHPYNRRLPAWPFFYKVIHRDLRAELATEEAWYASIFDGDASF